MFTLVKFCSDVLSRFPMLPAARQALLRLRDGHFDAALAAQGPKAAAAADKQASKRLLVGKTKKRLVTLDESDNDETDDFEKLLDEVCNKYPSTSSGTASTWARRL